MKKSALLLVLAMTAASLAGCGSKDEAKTEDTKQAAEAQDSTEVSDNAEAKDTDESALADGVLTVGTNAEFPPFEFVDDNGEPDGFDVALIKAIGEKMGVDVVIENMEFDALVASIGTKTDASIAGMTVTEERENMVDFSDSYYEAVQYVIVGADSEIKGAEDLEGITIGVQLGTTGDFIAEEIEGANVSQYNKAVDAVNDLINGRLDAVIIDKNPALVFGEKFGEDKIKLIDGADFEFETENYAIALPKGDTELKDAVNGALKELKEDGTFDALVSEYIGN